MNDLAQIFLIALVSASPRAAARVRGLSRRYESPHPANWYTRDMKNLREWESRTPMICQNSRHGLEFGPGCADGMALHR